MESTPLDIRVNYNSLKKNIRLRWIINRYKRIRDKIIKLKATITFLIRCRNSGIIPKFIKNSTKNITNIFQTNGQQSIQQSMSRYLQNVHSKILNLTIKEKHGLLEQAQKELLFITNNLSMYLNNEEMNKFLEYEDILAGTLIQKVKQVHKKKFECLVNLQNRELGIKFNKKWFVNKSDINIPEDVQLVLSLGQKHALPIKRENFPLEKVIADGEDLVQTLQNREEQEMARSRLTMVIDSHMNKMKVTNSDKFLLDKVKYTEKFLKFNKNIIILNADKGNTTVAMNKNDYDTRINNIVNDISTYQIVNKDPTNKLQKSNNDIVEELFKLKIIDLMERNKLKTNVATAPRLYGLPKIHKEDFPLRPICSSINSPSYELCKYITNILKKITADSKYNVRNSIEFKDKIKDLKIDNDERLISLDVVSLFPSIPVDLAMDIIDGKWNKIEEHTSMTKDLFLRIVKFCIVDNRYFQYNNNIYVQQKGLPMGSPASPIIADIVMEKLLDTCLEQLNMEPKILTKYVDDLFCIISQSKIEPLLAIFNSFDPNIKFTIERECNFILPYLDTLIIRRGNSLAIDWYKKPTSSGRIINYYSKHPKRIIINTAKNLIDRVLTISDINFHRKNKIIIENILRDNNFPDNLICKLIRQYKNQRNNTNTISEPKIFKSLIYLPKISERLEKSNIFDTEKYRIAHKMYNTVGRLFSKTKDKIQKLEKSNVVYKIPCNGNNNEKCNRVYVGTTKNKLKTRIAGHKTDQKYRNNISSQKTALASHCSKANHYPDFENVSVLNTENNYKRRYMLEMLQIINVPTRQRINFKADTDSVAQNYRYLLYKNGNGK